ncbi:MAG: Hsp20/alpha crystallin family protein [Spirochaetales bacterium]|nr:Hsp20/alpha crystallin family protein [Spirochaetales bacterium]
MRYLTRRTYGLSPFDSLFDELLNTWGTTQRRVPAVNITEEENAYVLEAELAGYKQDEVSVQVEKHVLKISSNKETNLEEETAKNLVTERCYRCFERAFTLPEDVDENKISAKFADGLLTLTLPKKPVEKPRPIEVKIK